MASIAKLLVSLGADVSHFETDMKRAARISKKQLGYMERQAKQLNDKWNRNFRLAGAAVAAGLVVATKAAADFEKAMAEVSTLTDNTPEQMKRLGDEIKKMSVQFGQMPVDQAKAMYQIISAGASDAATQLEHLDAANKLAVGGVTDVATAADGLTTVLNAYEGSGMSATDVSDILFTTMRNGKTTIEELSQSIGNVATIAGQTGVGFDQLGAAIGTLTKKGINTSQAMDAIRGVLSAVLKQSDQSVKMADELGVAFNATALEARGLHGFLADIAATGATSEQLSKLFGRVEGLNAVMALGSQDMKEFTRQLETMAGAAGATEDAVAKMSDSTAFKAAQARAAIETLKIEIGERFLASVSRMATVFVDNIDKITAAVEALATLIAVRVGVGVVASLAAATSGTTALAAAMAFLGGPIGAAALAITGLALSIKGYLDYVKEVEAIADRLKTAGDEVTQAWVDNASHEQLIAQQEELRRAWVAAEHRLEELKAQIGETNYGMKAYREEVEKLESLQKQAVDGLVRIGKALDESAAKAREATRAAGDLNQAMKDAEPRLRKAAQLRKDAIVMLDDLVRSENEHKSMVNEIDRIIENSIKVYEEWNDEQERSEQKMMALLDAARPLEAAMRDLSENVDFVHEQLALGNITAEQAAAVLEYLATKYGDVVNAQKDMAQSTKSLSTVMDESIRIATRSINEMWQDILSGSELSFDSILNGFKDLLANMASMSTQDIVIGFTAKKGSQGSYFQNGQFDWQSFGTDVAPFVAAIAGAAMGGYAGQGLATGAQIGSMFGPWGTVIGAAIGGLGGYAADQDDFWTKHNGSAINAYFGDFIQGELDKMGGIVGYLFGGATNIGDTILRKLLGIERPAVAKIFGNIAGVGKSKSDTDTSFMTAFGEVFFSSRRLKSDQIGQITEAITEFDNAIAELLDGGTIESIAKEMEKWGQKWEGAEISLENILSSRLDVVLEYVAESISAFVEKGYDFKEQTERLLVGLGAQKLLDEFSSIFKGRELSDLLNLVEQFKTGTNTISEAFQTVMEMLEAIVPVMESLRQYADSNLADDYAALVYDANVSLTEAVAGMQSALMDAILAFDGTPESLQNIGELALIVREGELKLLAQIDSIQQGINASLDNLRAKIAGLTETPKTAEEIFRAANALFADVYAATDASELAAIEQQFTSLINSLSEADQLALQTPLLEMIDGFQSAINTMLEQQRQNTLDNADSTRDLVDIFLNDIGDPLDILAASNQDVAAELGNIDDTLQDLGPTLSNAIRQGFGGANVNVTVVMSDGGLVNE